MNETIKIVKGPVKGRPNKATPPEAKLRHYHLPLPIEVQDMMVVADVAEQLHFLSVRQMHDIVDAVHEMYPDIPTHRSWSPLQAKRKTGYAFQEACFVCHPEFAEGRPTARKQAQVVFAEPDYELSPTVGGADSESEETTMATTTTQSAPAAGVTIGKRTKAAKPTNGAAEDGISPEVRAAVNKSTKENNKKIEKGIKAGTVTPSPAPAPKAAKAPKEPKPPKEPAITGSGRESQRGSGIRVKTFKVGKKTYDLSKKGFGMLGVIASEFPEQIKVGTLNEKEAELICGILKQRDQECGKPMLEDYSRKLRAYVGHAHKHLNGNCDCAELGNEYLKNPPMVTK